MAIHLLANTVWQQAAELRITDGSDVVTTDTDGLEILTGGPAHLSHTQSGTDARRYVYLNRAGGISCNAVVLTKATRHSARSVKLSSWSTYPGTRTDHINTGSWSLGGATVGINLDAYAFVGLSIVNAQAVGWCLDSTGYSKQMSQAYFCTAFSSGDWTNFRSAPEQGSVVIKQQVYLFSERASVTIENLTRAQVNTLRSLYRVFDQPVFIYDTIAGLFSNNLWHCMITGMSVQQQANDLLTVQLQLVRLREYP